MTNEYWDLGEEPNQNQQWPQHNERSLGRIMYAVVALEGKIISTHVDKGRFPKGKAPIIMRIELPYGKKDDFESMTGFPLTKPPEVSVSI